MPSAALRRAVSGLLKITPLPSFPVGAPHSARSPRHRIGPNMKPFWEPDETERKQIERIGLGNKGRPETPRRLT
jgi:hypothetical protein